MNRVVGYLALAGTLVLVSGETLRGDEPHGLHGPGTDGTSVSSSEWNAWYDQNREQAKGVFQKAVSNCISAGLAYPDSSLRKMIEPEIGAKGLTDHPLDKLPERLVLKKFFKNWRKEIANHLASLLVGTDPEAVPEHLPEGFLDTTPELIGDLAYAGGASHITKGWDLITCIENGMAATFNLWYETTGRAVERHYRLPVAALSIDNGAGGQTTVPASDCPENLGSPCSVEVSIQCNMYVPFLQPAPMVIQAEGKCVAATRNNICEFDKTQAYSCTSKFGWQYSVRLDSYSGLSNKMLVTCPGSKGQKIESLQREQWVCDLVN